MVTALQAAEAWIDRELTTWLGRQDWMDISHEWPNEVVEQASVRYQEQGWIVTRPFPRVLRFVMAGTRSGKDKNGQATTRNGDAALQLADGDRL